tara:strand:+ start:113 stop:469 length:357 start_codon:yes stop_codon:yes gene_type:complete
MKIVPGQHVRCVEIAVSMMIVTKVIHVLTVHVNPIVILQQATHAVIAIKIVPHHVIVKKRVLVRAKEVINVDVLVMMIAMLIFVVVLIKNVWIVMGVVVRVVPAMTTVMIPMDIAAEI